MTADEQRACLPRRSALRRRQGWPRMSEATLAPAKVVLLADDEESMRKVMERRVTMWGYTVLTAKDGLEALQMARARRPDLVLLDVMMPGLNGLQVCEQMKRDEALQYIPVILVSAKAPELARGQAGAVGAFAFLSKPYEPIELLKCMRAALGQEK